MNRQMIKKIVKSLTCTVLAFTMIAASSTYITAHADTLSDLKTKYSQLQKQQQSLQTKLNGLQGQVSDAKTKKETISKNVDVLNGQIDVLNQQIKTLDTQIEQTNKDIEKTEKDIKNNQKIYEERVCALYEAGNASKLQILLSSKNVTDFFTKVETLKVISDHDTKLIGNLKTEKTKLDNDKKALDIKKKSLDKSKGALVATQMDVSSQLAEQKKVVEQLNSSANQVASEKNTVKQEAAKTNKQINDQIAKIAEQRRQQLMKSGSIKAGSFINGDSIVGCAEKMLGRPYVWCAAGPNSFDCSGLVQYCLACAAGKITNASSSASHEYRAIDLSGMGQDISRDQLKPGDIVFFATGGGAVNHCGIYVGGDQFIAANTGHANCVQKCSLFSDKYWGPKYRGAQRIKY